MNLSEIKYLKSPEGQAAYEQYRLYDDKELELLILKNRDKNFAALVSLIKLRRQADGKFSKNEEMFFTPLSLEQATGERIARHIAKRFKPEWLVADLTCSLGGNAIFLAEQVSKVIAVDLDEEKIECAKENALVYGVKDKMEFILGDASLNIPEKADAFFLDPARDRDGLTKTRSFLNSRPALLEILPKLFAVTRNVAVKISPAFDYRELDLLPEQPEVEIISEDNSCKVAMLWFGDFKTAERRASCFRTGKFFTLIDGEGGYVTEQTGKYLLDPDKAITRAHLVKEIAATQNLNRLDPNLNYLTSDNPQLNNPEVFRIFEIEAQEEFSLKKLKNFLKSNKIERVEIIIKNLEIKPEELRKRLKIKEGGEEFIIAYKNYTGKKQFILAKKVN